MGYLCLPKDGSLLWVSKPISRAYGWSMTVVGTRHAPSPYYAPGLFRPYEESREHQATKRNASVGPSPIDALRDRESRPRLARSPPRRKAYPLLACLHTGHVALGDLHGLLVFDLGAELYYLGVFFEEW